MKVNTNQERLNELFDSDPRNDSAIAADLGVSKQTLSAWRKGIRSPKKSMLIRMSVRYNVSLEWLMGFDVEKCPSSFNAVLRRPLIIQNMDQFAHLLQYMEREDYDHVIAAFDRAYKKMKDMGIEP